MKTAFAGALIATAIILAVAGLYFPYLHSAPEEIGVLGGVHEHANFAVYVDGAAFNFSQQKFMSNGSIKLSRFVHLHGLDGGTIHKHSTGVRLHHFFESIGMSFNSSCISLGDGQQFCSRNGKSLKMIVNGATSLEFGAYEFHDLDRVLISYGAAGNAELKAQMGSVPDNACIPSGKCPERGTPAEESNCGADDNCTE